MMFVCPTADTLLVASMDVRNGNALFGALECHDYQPPAHQPLPFVSAYFQEYSRQAKWLRSFLRNEVQRGIGRHTDYLLALQDDCTDLEAHVLSELLIACGAKEVPMEYRAFLLAQEPDYLAVTASKRAVTMTRVVAGKDETERIFLPLPDADLDAVLNALAALDADGVLPVYTYDLPEALASVGTAVPEQVLARNFLRMT